MTFFDMSDEEERALISGVVDAIPKGWSGIVVLARNQPDGTVVISGSKHLVRETSIKILRELLQSLEDFS